MPLLPQIIRAASKLGPKVVKVAKGTTNPIRRVIPQNVKNTIKDKIIRARSANLFTRTGAQNRIIQNVDDYYTKKINKLKDIYRQRYPSQSTINQAKESLKNIPPGGSASTRRNIKQGIKDKIKEMTSARGSGGAERSELRRLIRERRVANEFLKKNYKDIVKDTIKRTKILRDKAAQMSLKEAKAGGAFLDAMTLKQYLEYHKVPANLIKEVLKLRKTGQILMGPSGLRRGLQTGVHEFKHALQYNINRTLNKRLSKTGLSNLPDVFKGMNKMGRPSAWTQSNPIYSSIDDIISKAGNLSTRDSRPGSAIMELAKRLQRDGIIPRNLKPNELNYNGLYNALLNVRSAYASPSSTLYKGPGTFRRLFPGGGNQYQDLQNKLLTMMERRRGDYGVWRGYFRRPHEISARLSEIRNIPGLTTLIKRLSSQGEKGDKVLKVLRKNFSSVDDILDVMSRKDLVKALDKAWAGAPAIPMIDYLNKDK